MVSLAARFHCGSNISVSLGTRKDGERKREKKEGSPILGIVQSSYNSSNVGGLTSSLSLSISSRAVSKFTERISLEL